MRPILAGLLVLALTLSGVGRALAAASVTSGDAPIVIAGVVVHICHSDDRSASGPGGDAAHHDCCESCALCAPFCTVQAPVIASPTLLVVYFAEHRQAMGWTPVLARLRTPRQAQGPPSA